MASTSPSASRSNGTRRQTAAFYDVDGTLIKTNVVHAYAYYAINTPYIGKRFTKAATLLGSLPLFWLADKFDRRMFNEAFYKNYAGYTEDRLVMLGEEVFENVIRPNIFEGAASLIGKSREQGHVQVLITGALDVVTDPLAEYLGVDHVIANRLELKDGTATGRLEKPVVAGANKALLVRQFAERHGLDLDGSFAYADSGSDVPLLSVVGHPCAVNPDFRMKTNARAYDWPVLDLK